jgi:hypothetical protein
VNAALKLPRKIIPNAGPGQKPKPLQGPGAALRVSIDDPSAHPAECGGANPPCVGKVLVIANPGDSCGTPPCPALPGYTDPKHPVFVTVDWFGGTFPATSTLYIVKDGSGTPTPIPVCSKSSGHTTHRASRSTT